MAALLEMRCRSCGKTHNFYLPDKDAFLDKATYDYVCPESGSPALLAPVERGQTVPSCPQGCVTVKQSPLREE